MSLDDYSSNSLKFVSAEGLRQLVPSVISLYFMPSCIFYWDLCWQVMDIILHLTSRFPLDHGNQY